MQGRKSLRDPPRSTDEAGEGPFHALKSPAVFTERGEVHIAARAQELMQAVEVLC